VIAASSIFRRILWAKIAVFASPQIYHYTNVGMFILPRYDQAIPFYLSISGQQPYLDARSTVKNFIRMR
jgi:hypothetical protein